MDIIPTTYPELRTYLRDSKTNQDVLNALPNIKTLINSSDEKVVYDAFYLLVDAFKTLRDATVSDIIAARSLILDYLLPELDHPSRRPQLLSLISQLRDDLVNWIEQYAEPQRSNLRDSILDRLIERIGSSDPRGALWTMIRIGYRRPDLPRILRSVTRRFPGEKGDTALLALVDLGVLPDTNPWLLASLRRRTQTHWSLALNHALRLAANPFLLPTVTKFWLSPDSSVPDIDRSYSLRVLTSTADKHYEQDQIQLPIWSTFQGLFENQLGKYTSDFFLGSDILPLINTDALIPDVLRWIGDSAARENPRLRYLLYLRLLDCVRPKQLRGWGKGLPNSSIDLIRQDAALDTRILILAHTEEAYLKQAAWDIALCAGCQDALSKEWFDQGVLGETSPFDQAKVLERMACFRLDPPPEAVTAWVRDHVDTDTQFSGIERDAQLIARQAAINVIRSSESLEAFDTLLNFGLEVSGKVLRDSADALADVAASLIQAGNQGIVRRLVSTALNPPAARNRTAAVGALQRLGQHDLLGEALGASLEQVLFNEAVPIYERATIAETLGYLPHYELSVDALRQLINWAEDPASDIGRRSLQTLIYKRQLLNHDDLLRRTLGIREVNGVYEIVPDAPRFEGWAGSIGLMYDLHPDQFESVVEAILGSLTIRDWYIGEELLYLLAHHYQNHKDEPVPNAIQRGLIKQAYIRQSTGISDSGVFQLLSSICPDALSVEAWDKVSNEWLPQSRAGLAAALGAAAYSSPFFSRKASAQLLLLAGDSQYAVRRAAYRSLAQQFAGTLLGAVKEWSEAADVQLRQRAAEACAWLDQVDSEQFSTQLMVDPEAIVRDTIAEARKNQRKRSWASEYLETVLSSSTNHSVLAAWSYARALTHVGDDSTIDALVDALRSNGGGRPLHVHHFITQTLKQLKENWRGVTKKWPDPWLQVRGRLEEGSGYLLLSDRTEVPVDYTLWQQFTQSPPSVIWGGTAVSMNLFQPPGTTSTNLRLADGTIGEIYVTNYDETTGGTVVIEFSGHGTLRSDQDAP